MSGSSSTSRTRSRRSLSEGTADDDVTPQALPLTAERRYIQRLRWYLTLRWAGVAVIYTATLLARELGDLTFSLAASNVLAPIVLGYNVAVWRLVVRWEREPPAQWTRKYRVVGNVQCSLDLIVLAIAIHFSGGLESPATFTMAAVLVVAGLVLSARDSIAQGLLACGLFDAVVIAEAAGWLHHVDIEVLAPGRVDDTGYVAAMVVAHNLILLFIVGIVVFIADRLRARESELVRLYAVEREAVVRLEQLDRLKSHFLATVSHELRTPLTAIMGFARTLVRSEPERPAGERHQLEAIDRQSRRLHKLVEDLLALSAVEAGDVPLRRTAVPLNDVVVDALRDCGDHDFDVDLAADVVVHVDRDRAERVVHGLLDNALKHGKAPRRVVSRRDGSVAVVCVEDAGSGVPTESADDVWDRFRQLELGPTRRGGGTGLGLALVKGMVEAHGGRAWHVRDRGLTRFCITFPLADGGPDLDPATPVDPPSAPAPAPGPTRTDSGR